MTLRLIGLAAATLLLAAPAPDDPTKKDQEKIQGTWKVDSIQSPTGEPQADVADMRWTFDGEKLSVAKGGNEFKKGTFRLDASKKPPALDLVPDDKDEKPTACIYQLDGDTLKIAAGKAGGDRPTEFKPDKDAGFGVVVLKRDKK
jgi:uncharacterized protein (TIGR03067 family)